MFDSHCHLTDSQFSGDVGAVLDRAREAGVRGFVTVASNAPDAEAACQLAEAHADVWCTVGIHPHEARSAQDEFERVAALLDHARAVAIGETGLDYYYDNAPRAMQRRVFDRHIELAGASGRPVVVHSRDADADAAAMIRASCGQVRGVLHCFTGGDRLLDAALECGWYVSFAGLITFRNFTGADLLRQVPPDRLLLETDSPYLAPVPHRRQRNEPAFLAATCAAAADLRGEDASTLGASTERNARQFYQIA